MITKELVINNKTGLHARPAALWVQTAGRYQSSIRLVKSEREVDGKSLLALLSLGLSAGSAFRLVVNGPDEAEAADALTALVAELAQEQ
ncbi:HPr family phosphocarrier protein [Acetonema longum]|uniref:Phosphocarrier protein HPr n=1 Tax=Acetonema longum DSM 6540 TaxID=1009370 RepID=F7NGY0_9FIRM|nr:HPr family phosphocarrier protein [Acetonema longum]EGO64711.1 phosphocarrier protein hpr [Acetonema longum DSM 6540]